MINQSYSNWEIIIVNDGSTDNSATILNQFSEKDNRIQLINKSNSGVSDTRNRGLEVAKGELVTFLDADDVWHATNLEKKVKKVSLLLIQLHFLILYLCYFSSLW